MIDFRFTPWWRHSAICLASLLLLAVGIVMVHLLAAPQEQPQEEWSVARLVHALQEDQVSRLALSAELAIVETAAGVRAVVVDAPHRTLIASLNALGVSADKLRDVEIVAYEPSPPLGPVSLLQSGCMTPILILVIGLGCLLFDRTSDRRKMM